MKESSVADAADKSLDDFDFEKKPEHNAKKKSRKSEKKETSEADKTNGHYEKENVSAPPKMNAFQFMMNSRHKTIGSNSPGREVDLNLSPESVVSKQELKSRRSRLENWAEQKGAAKRKREYEEVGNCINHKLQKREKKLRRLLNIDCQSDDEVIRKRKKKCTLIETDSESSNDVGDLMVEKEINKKKKKGRLALNKTVENDKIERDVESVKLTPKSVQSWKFKIKLSMDNNTDVETANETKSDSVVLNGTVETHNTNDVVEDLTDNDCLLTGKNNTSVENNDECILISLEEPTENITHVETRVLRIRKPKAKVDDDFIYLDSDEENTSGKKKKHKDVKVAPVFLKAVPKAKLDPKVAEARRQFLLSGVPSSLKKEMERQQCFEEVEFDVFPTVSHVQQKSSDDAFWDLPKSVLKLTPQEIGEIKIAPFSKSLLSVETTNIQNFDTDECQLSKIKNCKKIIKEIKSQNPDYPVYKVFNSIYAKSGYGVEKAPESVETKIEIGKTVPRRRGRPKKKSSEKKSETVAVPIKPEVKTEEYTSLWTEKYKPTSSADIIGNYGSVTLLKEWLSNWLKDLKKNKKCDSESEFEGTDDSCDSMKMSGNTVILKGPAGSGKTAAVYAVCNELGFNILEVNASSKRTGKRLLQELQEATQSHQVCKKETILSSFVKENKEKPSTKMCVLLIEDVDLVFEQDEGFTTAISQIMTTSKRPIILTTTDEPSSSIQKVISNQQTLSFAPLSSILTIWLQIVCLVEGFYVSPKSLDELLSYNRGDIRRTLLQLQLYVSSGGQRDKIEIKNECETFVDSDVRTDDDSSNLSDLRTDDCKESIQIHSGCVDTYQSVRNFKSFSLPHCNNLELVWWNLPTILGLPNFSKMRLERGSRDIPEIQEDKDKEKLKMLADCYESVAFADVLCGKSQFHETLDRRWRMRTKDGLGLDENMADYRQDGVSSEVAQTLISGRINMFKEKYNEEEIRLNMAVPEQEERRWRSKQLTAEEKLQNALLLSESLGRKAIALDYMPYLRSIARFEFERAASNTKRGNRFYNYLRNLGIRCGENTYKLACDVFKICD